MKIIGIPRALYYYEFGEIWISFFKELGLNVVLSDKTNGETIASGVKLASSDLCLPIKAMFGHIDNLIKSEKHIDYLFLPNIYKSDKSCYTCPRVIGLCAMVRAVFDDLPVIISPDYYGNMRRFLLACGKALGFGLKQSLNVCKKAAIKDTDDIIEKSDALTIALIGHCYNVRDSHLNMNIVKRLSDMNIRCITPDEVSVAFLNKTAGATHYKKPFWTSASRNLGYTKYVTDNKLANGIVFLNSFGCGTDSLSVDFCRDYIRKSSEIPCITISLDEHNAQAGLVTRLEAFADCLIN